MWATTPVWADLIGGVATPTVDVQCWYDGRPTATPTVISGTYRASLDADMVRASLDLTLDAADGQLLPVAASDPLAPYGQQLTAQLTLSAAGHSETLPLGRYVIDNPRPEGAWSAHGGRAVRIGDVVSIQAPDLIQRLAESPLRSLVQPLTGATVVSEVRRLCQGLVPVDTTGLAAISLTGRGMVYQSDRLAAVQQLAALAGRVPAMNRSGVLAFPQVATRSPSKAVTVAQGVWVDAVLTHSRDGIYNAVEVIGADPGNGRPVTGYARSAIAGDPYSANGPLGERLMQVNSELVRTISAAQAMAQSTLARQTTRRQVTFSVVTPWDPSVDVLDTHTVTVVPDRTDQAVDRVQVRALVTGIEWDMAGGAMTTTYSAPRQEVVL